MGIRLASIINAARFVGRNLWFACKLPAIRDEHLKDNLHLGPCTRARATSALKLYAELHDGQGLGLLKRVILQLAGSRLCTVVVNTGQQRVVGMMLAYFNERDRQENTVHIGFTGLLKEFRGRGLADKMRRHTYMHFASAPWLSGVSSRISLDNHASLKGALKLGYEERERYYDEVLGVERAYFVCDLEPYRVNR